MSDILRLVVLALLYFPILQFTSVLTEGTSPFTLISSLLIGLSYNFDGRLLFCFNTIGIKKVAKY